MSLKELYISDELFEALKDAANQLTDLGVPNRELDKIIIELEKE